MAWDGLRPDVRVGTPDTLRDHLDRWSRSTGIAVEVWALPGERLACDVAGLVHDTVQDLLDGAQEDGTVRTLSVALTTGATGLRLTLSTDGLGLTPERLAIRLRARRAWFTDLGGTLSLNAVPLSGLTLNATLPAEVS